MTELLERAIAQLKTLPAAEQDAIAARLLAEMKDEQLWQTQFKSTTDDQWDRMVEMVRQEIATGATTPLAEVFPLSLSDEIQRYQSVSQET